jgi:hypothetical protein
MSPIIVAMVLASGSMFALYAWRYYKTQRALSEPVETDRCVACQSTEVTTFAPECYRCNACRFEWGDGIKAQQAAMRSAQITALNPEQRKSFALNELDEADAHLRAADAAFEQAASQLLPDLMLGSDMYSRTRSEGIVTAVTEMGFAQKHMRNVAEATNWRIVGGDQPIDFRSEMFALDRHFDSWLVDVAAHMQVETLRPQVAAMREGVAMARIALRAQPPA